MPSPATAPVTTPTRSPAKNPEIYPGPDPKIFPDEICPQQRREHVSPDVSP